MKNVMLIGIGPHSKRIYINCLKKLNVNIKVAVDLESNYASISNYLLEVGLNDTAIWCLPDKYKDNCILPIEYNKKLKNVCDKYKITHIILSTEPKAHNMYLNFALENNINILSDKPITVVKKMQDMNSIEEVHNQYYKLLKKYNPQKCKCVIMCQRRIHRGYIYVEKLLKDIISKYNIPITYIDIYHCDGNWENAA